MIYVQHRRAGKTLFLKIRTLKIKGIELKVVIDKQQKDIIEFSKLMNQLDMRNRLNISMLEIEIESRNANVRIHNIILFIINQLESILYKESDNVGVKW